MVFESIENTKMVWCFLRIVLVLMIQELVCLLFFKTVFVLKNKNKKNRENMFDFFLKKHKKKTHKTLMGLFVYRF